MDKTGIDHASEDAALISLSAPLRQLLAELRAEQKNQGRALDFVFPGEGNSGY